MATIFPNEKIKSSAGDFLENERHISTIERGGPLRKSFVSSKRFSDDEQSFHERRVSSRDNSDLIKSHAQLESQDRPVRVRSNVQKTDMVVANKWFQLGQCGPIRYEAKCFVQPKQRPVWFTETMVVKIGSTKKKFFESVQYENKFVPYYWSETLKTDVNIKPNTPVITSQIELPIEEAKFHYMSLEPQQIAAKERESFDDIIEVI